jgi:hypothetical protein
MFLVKSQYDRVLLLVSEALEVLLCSFLFYYLFSLYNTIEQGIQPSHQHNMHQHGAQLPFDNLRLLRKLKQSYVRFEKHRFL